MVLIAVLVVPAMAEPDVGIEQVYASKDVNLVLAGDRLTFDVSVVGSDAGNMPDVAAFYDASVLEQMDKTAKDGIYEFIFAVSKRAFDNTSLTFVAVDNNTAVGDPYEVNMRIMNSREIRFKITEPGEVIDAGKDGGVRFRAENENGLPSSFLYDMGLVYDFTITDWAGNKQAVIGSNKEIGLPNGKYDLRLVVRDYLGNEYSDNSKFEVVNSPLGDAEMDIYKEKESYPLQEIPPENLVVENETNPVSSNKDDTTLLNMNDASSSSAPTQEKSMYPLTNASDASESQSNGKTSVMVIPGFEALAAMAAIMLLVVFRKKN